MSGFRCPRCQTRELSIEEFVSPPGICDNCREHSNVGRLRKRAANDNAADSLGDLGRVWDEIADIEEALAEHEDEEGEG